MSSHVLEVPKSLRQWQLGGLSFEVNKDIYDDDGKFNNWLGLITTTPTPTIISFQMCPGV